MERFRRVWAVSLLLMLLMCSFPLTVYANSPPPAPWYTFELKNAPEGTVYMDLLICLDETESQYSRLEEENVPRGFSESAEIISYCEDGFCSYTFHYAGAKSRIRLNQNSEAVFFIDGTNIFNGDMDAAAQQHKDDIEARGKVRLALLDAQGNILQVSTTHSLKPAGLFSYNTGTFVYDAGEDTLDVESDSNLTAVVLFLLVSIGGMAASCLTEWMVALAFDGIRRYSRLVVLTNLVSQLLMRIGQILLLRLMVLFDTVLTYVAVVAVLEILVYLCEFLFYRRAMKAISWKRCLAFTFCANTASLVTGCVLLLIFIF